MTLGLMGTNGFHFCCLHTGKSRKHQPASHLSAFVWSSSEVANGRHEGGLGVSEATTAMQ